MNISNSDLDFLIQLEKKLGKKENWSWDACKLCALNAKLIRQRNKSRERTRNYVKEKRKTDITYGRSKQEIERINKRIDKELFN